MGGIWSQQSTQDDEDNTNSVDDSDSEVTEASEDERINPSPTIQASDKTHNSTSNNTNGNKSTENKHNLKDKDKFTSSDNPTTKKNDSNGNNDDTKINKTPTTPKPHKTLNVEPKPQDDPPTTRRWRSNSARGLKRVDLQNVNILVVDDDAVQRAVLRKWLHDEKYKNGILPHHPLIISLLFL